MNERKICNSWNARKIRPFDCKKDLKDLKKDFKRLPCQERACRSCITERSCTSELLGESFLWRGPYNVFSALRRTMANRGGRGRGQRGRLYPINETGAVKYILSCGGCGAVGERGRQGSRCHVSSECRTCVQDLNVIEKPHCFDAFLVLRFATIIMRRILTSADSNYIFWKDT